MGHTYKALLRGNQLEWVGDAPGPSVKSDRAVPVHVTILDEVSESRPVTPRPGDQMAAALEQLAAIRALADLTDPAAWERQARQDRPLPDRD